MRHPRYNHPVYGEVERCNWEPECVKNWDFNKATFDALPPEEQARQIAEKEKEEKIKAEQLVMPSFQFPNIPQFPAF